MIQISLQFEQLVKHLAKSVNRVSVTPLSTLLSKLIKIGFVTVNINSSSAHQSDDFLSSIWSKLLHTLARQDVDLKGYSCLWVQLISDLPRDDLRTYLGSFLAHIQVNMQLDQLALGIADGSGTRERAVAELYDCYLGNLVVEGEDNPSEILEVLLELVINHPGWNIGTARCLSRWILNNKTRAEVRSTLAQRALRKFCNHCQISYGCASHHVVLILFILLNLCPVADDVDVLDISADMNFVEGLNLSLSSLRHRFRLLGMLLGEVATGFYAKRHPEQASLTFGSSQWEIKDEDTKLCQEIRIFVDKWVSLSDPCVGWKRVLEERAEQINTASSPLRAIVQSDLDKIENPPSRVTGLASSSTGPTLRSKSSVDASNGTPTENIRLLTNVQGLSQPVPTSKRKGPLIQVMGSSSPPLVPYNIPDEDLAELNGTIDGLGLDGDDGIDQAFTSGKKAKTKIPVYISDLTEYLRDAESFEKIEIGLKTAASLIRTKAGWGAELGKWFFCASSSQVGNLRFCPWTIFPIENKRSILMFDFSWLM